MRRVALRTAGTSVLADGGVTISRDSNEDWRAALQASLPPERFAEFEARRWAQTIDDSLEQLDVPIAQSQIPPGVESGALSAARAQFNAAVPSE